MIQNLSLATIVKGGQKISDLSSRKRPNLQEFLLDVFRNDVIYLDVVGGWWLVTSSKSYLPVSQLSPV